MENEKDDEPIEPFGPVPPAVEKVMDLDSGTYKARVVLFYTDKYPDYWPRIDPNARYEFTNPVPVHTHDGKVLGYATVLGDNGQRRFLSDLFLIRGTAERFDIETGKKLYPETAFKIVAQDLIRVGLSRRPRLAVTRARIEYIYLQTAKPLDDRIVAVGEPVL